MVNITFVSNLMVNKSYLIVKKSYSFGFFA